MSASRRLRRSLAVATLALVPATPAVAADDIAISPAELTRTYRGADGSALYTRAVGETVVGLGEHPGTDNTIKRVILPFLHDQAGMRELFEAEPDEEARNEAYSAAFRDQIAELLARGGITADFAYPPSRNLAWRYAWGTPPTSEYFPSNDELHYLEAGSGGLKMSAVEYARFLAGFENDRFLSAVAGRELKDDRLGFDDRSKTFVGTGAVGPLYTKNGGSGGGASRSMIYPGDVQVFISSDMLRAAWEAALL